MYSTTKQATPQNKLPKTKQKNKKQKKHATNMPHAKNQKLNNDHDISCNFKKKNKMKSVTLTRVRDINLTTDTTPLLYSSSYLFSFLSLSVHFYLFSVLCFCLFVCSCKTI